ncbi:MAG TPA: SGNH/GDSL hydrolase family protein [Pyrinomonadaceae bacterium]
MGDGEQRGPLVYAALGDSTGAGVGAREGGGYVARLFERIERARPGSRLVNLSVSGATTEHVLFQQVGRLLEGGVPSLVTLGIGINDVQRLMLEEYERNLEQIVRRVRAATDAPFVLTNIPDITCSPAVPEFMRAEARKRIDAFNAALARVAALHSLTLVDVYTKSRELLPARPDFFCSDLFHPSDEGYRFWADEMWPAVEQAIEQ